MGHKGDIEVVYTTNKGRLPENIVEDMQAAYQRTNEFLTIAHQPREIEKKELALEALRSVAQGFGIDPMHIRIENRQELGREPYGEEEIHALQLELKRLGGEKRTRRRSSVKKS